MEGVAGLGAALICRLATDGIEFVDVPAKLAARLRLLSTAHGRKNDNADAISVGIAAMTATGRQSVRAEDNVKQWPIG